jgi:hypothetical protein
MNEFDNEVNDGLVEADFELTELPELEYNDVYDNDVQFETNVFFEY